MKTDDVIETLDPNHAVRAVSVICVAWLFFTFADTFTKVLVQSYDGAQVLFLRGGIGFVMAVCFAYFFGGGRNCFQTEKLKFHILRGVMITCISYVVVKSLSMITLADFYTFIFMTPLFVGIVSNVLLGERVGIYRFTALVVGFVGILIMVGPRFEMSFEGFIYAALLPCLICCDVILVRRIGKGDSIFLFPVLPFLFITLSAMPAGLAHFEPVAAADWIYFILLPLFMLGGQSLFAKAFIMAPRAIVVAPFHYTQMLWGIILGYIFFDTIPQISTLTGGAIVIAAGLFLIYRDHQIQKTMRQF